MNIKEVENEINKEEEGWEITDADEEINEKEDPLTEVDIIDLLKKARQGGYDEFLETLMKELEWVEDMVYNENLTAANYIYWKTRCETLKEIKNKYCDYISKK